MKDSSVQIVRTGELSKIFNYDKYISTKSPRRALLSYLTKSVIDDLNGVLSLRFSNDGLAKEWPRVLNELGYIVDIINFNDRSFVPEHTYDLAVLHGAQNFKNIIKNLKPIPIVHFTTGSYWKFNNAQELARLADFKKRHRLTLQPDRLITASEDPLNNASRGVIGLGNDFTRRTYASHPNVVMLNNATYPDSDNRLRFKKLLTGRKKFIFFSGGGNIHKGLDLAIEAFRNLPADLFIVTPLEKPIVSFYKSQGIGSNIHFIDQVEFGSSLYYQLLGSCCYALLPSCSEGQPGSVLDCLQAGIIPIITRECGIDNDKPIVVLKDASVLSIMQAAQTVMKIGPIEYIQAAQQARRLALRKYSPPNFRINLKSAITEFAG